MNQEMIEKLKDPKQARQAGWLQKYRPENYDILKAAGHRNRLVLTSEGEWNPDCAALSYRDCAILKPDYTPEPEYDDCEIFMGHCAVPRLVFVYHGSETLISNAVDWPNFVCYRRDDGVTSLVPGSVPQWIRTGHHAAVVRLEKE